ncbi:MAG: hypothetical protein KKE62_01155 [Proteobacteria bacterium]|nr:hypothetical protein [Pseudomonadota bacterium]MBU1386859.1 hypothetical protein [Pseudomonadota bacterium]MBU1541426.1 hypothetical protein [Pseudomonadota bacterium]MBU2431371.1 hypothetical protein [Pseudomonadota bacterium]MBU2483080.1 hypothetical protein [Pseudomonadota bacterium]
MICVPVIGSFGPFLVEARAADHTFWNKDMLHLEFAQMKKHPNGQVSQTFIVHRPENQTDKISVLFQENQRPEVYTVPLDQNTFSIFADKPSSIRLFVFTRAGQTHHVVHTDMVLFGKSRSLALRTLAKPSEAAVLKTLPHIFLVGSESYYWHQTGIPLTFSLKTQFHPLHPVRFHVADNHQIKPLAADTLNPLQFVYTPSHDKQLRQAGSTAVKHNTVFTCLAHDKKLYHLAYTFQLHRSRHAFENYTAGAIALAGGFLVFAGWVIKKRKTPWWKE